MMKLQKDHKRRSENRKNSDQDYKETHNKDMKRIEKTKSEDVGVYSVSGTPYADKDDLKVIFSLCLSAATPYRNFSHNSYPNKSTTQFIWNFRLDRVFIVIQVFHELYLKFSLNLKYLTTLCVFMRSLYLKCIIKSQHQYAWNLTIFHLLPLNGVRHKVDPRQTYYVSMEFLQGRMQLGMLTPKMHIPQLVLITHNKDFLYENEDLLPPGVTARTFSKYSVSTLADARLLVKSNYLIKVHVTAEAIKINLGSCISVYNHAYAFPELVAIPATKRGNWGGGVSTKLSGYQTNRS
ncbi:hypothetical protein LXL04_023641 [Taraxacum kok-saghyz]